MKRVNPLIGKFFLASSYYGVVLAEASPGLYLVEILPQFGQPAEQKTVTIKSMDGWRWFDTNPLEGK